jgi:SAM-dependent methyltransferase
MLDAPILAPCRALAARALAAELDAPRVVFEGGAGVGVVLRTLLSDAALAPSLVNVRSYHFTELDPAILAMGRAALARRAPEPFARALRYRRLDLDVVARDPGAAGLARGEADVVVLEHVLYDVEDLGATLDALRWILRPGGALIFTGAFRGRPASFFPCEMLQLTLASYRRARLDPPYRTEVGYLPLDAWARSLARAGFTFEVWPPPSQHERMPHGGVVARAP